MVMDANDETGKDRPTTSCAPPRKRSLTVSSAMSANQSASTASWTRASPTAIISSGRAVENTRSPTFP
jgi:hypothetical protein